MIVKMWRVETGAANHWVFAETYGQVKEVMTQSLEEQLGAGSVDQLEALEEMEIWELKYDDLFKFTTYSGHTFDLEVIEQKTRTILDSLKDKRNQIKKQIKQKNPK